MKIAFFGTPEFAVPALKWLLQSDHEVLCAVTQPDKPAGRGQKLTPPPVKVLAEEAGIPVLQPKTLRDGHMAEKLRFLAPDVAVIVAYGKLVPPEMLSIPKFGFLNIHASLLPKYRGAAPIQWAIARGERKTGVTIMQLDEGMDTGPMIARREVEILEDDDARSLSATLSHEGALLMVETLAELAETGSLSAEPQDEAEATYAPLIERKDARIEWNWPAEKLIYLVRGFAVWPGAYTHDASDKTIKLTGVEPCDTSWVQPSWKSDDVETGTVVDVLKGHGLVIKCGEESLLLVTRLKPQGSREMEATSYFNGGGVAVGDRFR
ncbi:MAG: methionyl-tRNA formyltransferase [Sumerlaeia bacterium]